MTGFILLTLLVIVCVVMVATFYTPKSLRHGDRKTPNDLHIKRPFLTNREREFYKKLDGILNGSLKIMCQVRLVDVVSINPKYKGGKEGVGYFRRISQWHCDFVLIDDQFNVKCVIELDDKSHNKPDRIKRDNYFNLALKQSGIKLIRFNSIKELNGQSLIEIEC